MSNNAEIMALKEEIYQIISDPNGDIHQVTKQVLRNAHIVNPEVNKQWIKAQQAKYIRLANTHPDNAEDMTKLLELRETTDQYVKETLGFYVP